MSKWWLATDCEGPLSLNDYAFELCAEYIPEGGKLFSVLSRYDDYMVAVERRPGHPAGSTLRWVAPFLKAFGLTEQAARAFAARNLLLVPGARQVLGKLKDLLPTYIISASYRQYLEALCLAVSLPLDRARATPFPLDGYSLKGTEEQRLREMATVVASLAPPEWPPGARGMEDLPEEQRRTVQVLEAVLEEMQSMEVATLMEEVVVVGGLGKARALEEIGSLLGCDSSTAMYIGDSITDVEALEQVRRAGGMAVAFNANRYALAAAEVACLSAHAGPILAVAAAFARGGPEAVRRLVSAWPVLPAPAQALWQQEWGQPQGEICYVAGQGRDELVKRSEVFRRGIRGEAIGSLG